MQISDIRKVLEASDDPMALAKALEAALAALDAIHGELDGKEWFVNTTMEVADIIVGLGYTITEPADA